MRAAPVTAAVLPHPQEILAALPAVDVARSQLLCSASRQAVAEEGASLLPRRGWPADTPWRAVAFAERAQFLAAADPRLWEPGPNQQIECNALESDGQSPWLWLSGGTDWQGFQGGFLRMSAEGIQPTWVSFQVQIATPALSGAFLVLSSGKRTWGLEEPLVVFSYRGDEGAKQRRRFVVQSVDQRLCDPHCLGAGPVEEGRSYAVAMGFDWQRALLSVWLDGQKLAAVVPFQASKPMRFAAVYNWRSGARTAFSEVSFGDARPLSVPFEAPARAGVIGARALLLWLAVFVAVLAVVLQLVHR